MEASALFLPFGYDLWITLAVWIILGSVALYYACYITDAFLGAIEDFKFMKSFFFVFGALCAQSRLSWQYFIIGSMFLIL